MISGDAPEMPRDAEPLTAAEVATIARWIDAGAKWPADRTLVDRSRDGPWWSLKPLARSAGYALRDFYEHSSKICRRSVYEINRS